MDAVTKTISKTKTATAIILATALVGVAGFSASLFLNAGKKVVCPACPACEKCTNCDAGEGEKKNVDLILLEVSHVGTGSGSPIITLTIQNLGSDSASNVYVKGTKGSQSGREIYSLNIPSIGPGESVTKEVRAELDQPAHTQVYLYHTVDPDNTIEEIDDENNQKFSSYYFNR